MLISNDYYPALARENVDVVTDGIAEVTPECSSSRSDGTVREVDAIVVATGFHVTDSPTFETIIGRDGRTLAADLRPRAASRPTRAPTIANFPNMFFLVGPNTGLGPHLDGLHDRVADQLRRRRARDDRPARAAAPSRSANSRSVATIATCRPSWRAASGTPAAARAGIWTSTATTPPCGPASPSSSAGRQRNSMLAAYETTEPAADVVTLPAAARTEQEAEVAAR